MVTGGHKSIVPLQRGKRTKPRQGAAAKAAVEAKEKREEERETGKKKEHTRSGKTSWAATAWELQQHHARSKY